MHSSLLGSIGNTPLVPLVHLSKGLRLPVYVKCEFMNPGGSVKDRLAKAILDDAEARGLLRPGMTLIEATAGVGTGGTITGVGRRLKAFNPRIKIVLADPMGSSLADWVEQGILGADGPYAIEGIGASEVPDNLHRDVIDSAERISDEESFATVKRLIREEGLLVGGSSGTNVAAALRLAARGDVDGPIVTLLPDAWDRYRAKPWMRQLSEDRR